MVRLTKMASQRRLPSASFPGRSPRASSAGPAPCPYSKPPRTIPAVHSYHGLPTRNSILGQPFPTQPKPFLRHPPPTDVDGFQPVSQWYQKKPKTPESCQLAMDIEAKSFTFKEKASVHGPSILVSEHQPSLIRTIFVPFLWLDVSGSIHFQQFLAPQWFQFGIPKLKALISTNNQGQYLSVTEILPDLSPTPFVSLKAEIHQVGHSS